MSREKQIEEMAKVLEFVCELQDKDLCIGDCYMCRAKALYKSGCRIRVDGVWKKVSDKAPRYACSACDHLFNNKEYKYCPFCGAKMTR